MAWYILYKGKAVRGTLQENLTNAHLEYFIPRYSTEVLADDRMVVREEEVMKNLIFVNTTDDILTIANAIDGLRSPYIDRATHQPAVVSDAEMQRFMHFLEYSSINARILQDPFHRFKVCQKVRVKAGDFAGTEGYIFRIRGDRKLVISLGEMAVAISGIHHTLLEPVSEKLGGGNLRIRIYILCTFFHSRRRGLSKSCFVLPCFYQYLLPCCG